MTMVSGVLPLVHAADLVSTRVKSMLMCPEHSILAKTRGIDFWNRTLKRGHVSPIPFQALNTYP